MKKASAGAKAEPGGTLRSNSHRSSAVSAGDAEGATSSLHSGRQGPTYSSCKGDFAVTPKAEVAKLRAISQQVAGPLSASQCQNPDPRVDCGLESPRSHSSNLNSSASDNFVPRTISVTSPKGPVT